MSQIMSHNETNETTMRQQPMSVSFGSKPKEKVLRFLRSNPNEEYNLTSLSKRLDIPIHTLSTILRREFKKGKIYNSHRGFYSANCTLNQHQIRKIEENTTYGLHNICIKVPKNNQNPNFLNSVSFGGTVGINETTLNIINNEVKLLQNETTLRQDKNNGIINQISFEVVPNQDIHFIEYSKIFMVFVGASENPLSPKDFLWLRYFLISLFGEIVDNCEVRKIDINADIPVSFSKNEITIGNVNNDCLALYGKGDITRFELRNHYTGTSLKCMSDNLFEFVKAVTKKPESEVIKATESNQKQHETVSA